MSYKPLLSKQLILLTKLFLFKRRSLECICVITYICVINNVSMRSKYN